MARTADPRRRAELLDSIVDYLADHGLSTLSMRPLAEHLGKSTRVLTHHFADKDELLSATMERLDARHRAWLRELPGWQGDDSVGTIVRRTWDWQLREDNLPVARLIREIEGLAAGAVSRDTCQDCWPTGRRSWPSCCASAVSPRPTRCASPRWSTPPTRG
ncbi:TetR/AcrR family transcriptional regulator [Nonomuraea recticatena]|uniref:TetR/AcrR family transcriptional regulator n=1 Tax=Nonomuraea recticatena TaxID=46178 RepID=UPI003611E94C